MHDTLPACPTLTGFDPRGDRMFIHGLEAHGHHGVFADERIEAGQRFVVDVDWWIATAPAVRDDSLAATLCYGQLFATVADIVTGRPCALIETLADRIVAALFDRFPEMTATIVTVHQPDAPIAGSFADLGISMARHRDEA